MRKGEAEEEPILPIFGAEAYENLKQQNDPTYKMLKEFAEAWELKEKEVQSVYECLHGFHD